MIELIKSTSVKNNIKYYELTIFMTKLINYCKNKKKRASRDNYIASHALRDTHIISI